MRRCHPNEDNVPATVECPECHKTMTKPHLARHMYMHSDDRTILNCPKCTKTFYHKNNLEEHHKRVHEGLYQNEQYKKELCNICGIKVARKSDLQKHLITHLDTRPYQCDQCDSTYKRPDALRSHIANRHLNIRPHTCSYCGLGFFTKRILNNHIRTHTDERPFSCEICQQTFRIKAGLYLHKQHHH